MRARMTLAIASMGFFMSDTAMAQIDSMFVEKVRVQAAAELGWKGADMVIQPIDTLSQHGCQFFAIRHSRQIDGPVHGYAVLPDGLVLGRQLGRLERILAACGDSADALWWAGVINHHADTGGILVTEKETPLVAKELKQATGKDVEPVLVKSPHETVLQFYTHEHQRNRSYHVQANWRKSEGVTLKKTPV